MQKNSFTETDSLMNSLSAPMLDTWLHAYMLPPRRVILNLFFFKFYESDKSVRKRLAEAVAGTKIEFNPVHIRNNMQREETVIVTVEKTHEGIDN